MEAASQCRFRETDSVSRVKPPSRKCGKRLQSSAQRLCRICQGLMAAKKKTISSNGFPPASRANSASIPSAARLTSSMGSRAEKTDNPSSLMQGAMR